MNVCIAAVHLRVFVCIRCNAERPPDIASASYHESGADTERCALGLSPRENYSHLLGFSHTPIQVCVDLPATSFPYLMHLSHTSPSSLCLHLLPPPLSFFPASVFVFLLHLYLAVVLFVLSLAPRTIHTRYSIQGRLCQREARAPCQEAGC